jgi:subtilisin family serine protease
MVYSYKQLFAILPFLVVSSFAQNTGKMNFELARKTLDPAIRDQVVSVLIQGNIPQIKNALPGLGGKFKYAAGDIASISIPVKSIGILADKSYTKRLEARVPHFKTLCDSMRIKANVNPVREGQAPLTQGYDGTGVVMGIVDTGIDFTNPDFKDSLNGKTRIKYIWDQNQPNASNTPARYGYGQAWNNVQIDAGLCLENDNAYFGHGTATCGISAGNGKGSPNHEYMGVAPNADFIVVALNFNSQTAITDAVDYIYSTALTLGEPCVINLSVGDVYGSHDGKDLQAQLMDSMLTAYPGRAMVAASGDEGGKFIHLGYNLSASDTNFTWFQFPDASYAIEFWADTANFKNARMAIGADLQSPYLFRGHSKFIGTSDNLGIITYDTLFNPLGYSIAQIESNTTLVGGTYDISYLIIPDSSSSAYNWRLMFTGQGKFDLWDTYGSSASASSAMVNNGLPIAPNFPSIIHYKLPDTLQTICSSYQCLEDVITVGNFNNKKTFIDVNGNTEEPHPGITPGNIDATSSIGPTRDGRIKPDIAAPGAMTITTAVLIQQAQFDSQYPAQGVQIPGYTTAGGTSASSPVVAGVAALYLQKYPNASCQQVKNALLACPKTDSFTGVVPNISWGNGKVDAFATLTACLTTGIRPNPSENVQFSIYPNPFTENAVLTYNISSLVPYSGAQVKIYDITGKLVRTIVLTDQVSVITFPRQQLESGAYTCNLLIDGRIIKSSKLQVL